MIKVRAFFCLIAYFLVQVPLVAQPIRFVGRVQDSQNHQFISAIWRWTDGNNQLLLEQKSTAAGFEGFVPANAHVLSIISAGYRSVRLPVYWPGSPPDSIGYRVIIPLVPVDKMTTDQPYFQSEQRPVTLSSRKTGKSLVQFSLFDALTDQPVHADICLFFTKTDRKHCQATNALRIEIEQEEIVAVEVRAMGYQPYLGNVVVNLSEKHRLIPYKIRLNPTPTIVMVLISDLIPSVVIYIKKHPNGPTYSASQLGDRQFIAHVPPGLYMITGQEKNRLVFQDTLRIREGLTGYGYKSQRHKPGAYPAEEQISYFDQSSYELTAIAKQQLNKIARLLLDNPKKKLNIVGHTDNVGNPHLNVVLSEFRAKITQAYLIRLGVSENRIQIEGVGSTQPAASNHTEETRRKNRRVSLKIL